MRGQARPVGMALAMDVATIDQAEDRKAKGACRPVVSGLPFVKGLMAVGWPWWRA